jgi:adenylate cyclase class 2
MMNLEIECRFLEIDKDALIKKLRELGARDFGEAMLEETIMYNAEGTWKDDNRIIRLRKKGHQVKLSYKEHRAHTIDGTHEIEFEVSDKSKAEALFTAIGFPAFRYQQKKRHTFEYGGVMFDIDTWPKIPTYVELEGKSEDELKKMAAIVGYQWKDAVFHDPAWVIENHYHIPVRKLKWFTFERIE